MRFHNSKDGYFQNYGRLKYLQVALRVHPAVTWLTVYRRRSVQSVLNRNCILNYSMRLRLL